MALLTSAIAFAASAAALHTPQHHVQRRAVQRRAAPALDVAPPLEADARWPGWSQSVDAKSDLLYMPFLEHQLGALAKLGAKEVPTALPPHLALATKAGTKGTKARVGSRVFEVPGHFRRVRMTYFDGGESLQVFNSLWYPVLERADAPLLGIDLLKFGAGKYLCVVDAQPPAGRGEDGSVPHDTARLDAVRAANEPLRGEVSTKWYDDNRFFSRQMLYGRFSAEEGPEAVRDVLFPAFVAYLDAYVDAVAGCAADASRTSAARAAHADYDAFNAARDPAHGLFTSYFGPEWADDFVHEFLFALSEADGSDKDS